MMICGSMFGKAFANHGDTEFWLSWQQLND
jgi:hypothetical protein